MPKKPSAALIVCGLCAFLASCSLADLFGGGDLLPDTAPKATQLPFSADEMYRYGKFGFFPNPATGPNFHGGIDCFPYKGKTATFYAIADGTVSTINTDTKQGYDGDKGARNYLIEISISKTVKAHYHFEAAFDETTGLPLTEAQVDANILVRKGDSVRAGDAIGILPYRCSSTHVHFSIHEEAYHGEGPDMPSPLTYFDTAGAARLNELDLIYK